MAQNDCKAQFVTAVLKFKATVHVEGENAYKELITDLKEISLKFVDDLEGANIPVVLHSIKRRDGHHFKQSLTVHHEQQRFDPYAVHDEGWDEETEELVSDIFKYAGYASEALNTVYKKIAILKSKVRQESFLKVINAVPLPNTTMTVLYRKESEMGLDVDKERIRDHMPRPAFLEAYPPATRLLGALTHFIMRNNVLRVKDKYTIKDAKNDFKDSYTVLKRVFSGVRQKGGSYYEKRAAEQQGDEATPAKKARRSETDRPSEAEQQVENIQCKYCGKSFKSEESYNKHIGEVHPSEKNIFTCPFCAEPFGRFIGYIDHLKEHEDRVIRCKICKKVCNTLFRLRIHQKIHVNQCPFCAANFSSKDELVNHVDVDHKESPQGEERQCSLCEATFTTLEEVTNHIQQVHRRFECNICFMRFSAEHQLLAHRQDVHEITNPGANVSLRDPSDQPPQPPAPAADEGETDPAAQGDRGDQTPRSGERVEQGEPETPKKDKELKGHKRETEVFSVLCQACNRYLRDLKTRRLHIRAYHAKQLKSCHYCKRSYLDPWDYNTHMNDNHVWCELCRGYARDQTAYDAHYKEKHEPAKKSPMKVSQREPTPTPEPSNEPTQEPVQEPDVEPTPEPQSGQVSQSVISTGAATSETDREDRPFKCKHCNEAFAKAGQRNTHIKTVHRIHHCNECNKSFLTEKGRDQHTSTVHKHPKFYCNIERCSVCAETLGELHWHRRNKHWPKFPFRCNQCLFALETRDSLDRHRRKEHDVPAAQERLKYKCQICKKNCLSLTMFIDHSSEHEENVHKCRECNWCFASLDQLHTHCRTTHDTMHNACDICGTDFPTTMDLDQHKDADH